MTIRELSTVDFDEAVPALAEILADAVDSGASVGFRKPFGRKEAEAWWRGRPPGDGLRIWTAAGGTISLVLEGKPNGRHRAEIVKLMVHRSARGQGLGRALLAAAEQAATSAGITLLLLDTQTGGAAERLYRAAGWTLFGVVPDYATDPDGKLQASSFFYKRLPS